MSTDTATFPQYTFNFTEQLRVAAFTSLTEFEKNIQSNGYDWLEQYMDEVRSHDFK
jgi:hypothetical protein